MRTLLLFAALLAALPTDAAPNFLRTPAVPATSDWTYSFADDGLESAWAYTAQVELPVGGEARVAFHFVSPGEHLFLQLRGTGTGAALSWWRVSGGLAARIGEPEVVLAGVRGGALTLQRTAWRARVLWNGRVVSSAFGAWQGGQIGTAARGATISGGRLQPVEPVVKRDDFMRATGPLSDGSPPDEAVVPKGVPKLRPVAAGATDFQETPGDWRTISGSWKTSMMIDARVRFDSSLNPNPFVYRAQAGANSQASAATGKWFWSDYSVAVALKPVLKSANAPLVAGLAAYAQPGGNAVVGEIDFHSGLATLRQGATVLAKSEKPFSCAANQWHRVFLDPGPGPVRLVIDGVERLRATPAAAPLNWQNRPLAQGEVQLRAQTGGENFVDFDDVAIAPGDAISDDFTLPAVGRWDDFNGEWQTRTTGRAKTTRGPALTVTGDAGRSDGMVEAGFARERGGAANGIVFGVRDGKNYFLARQSRAALEIVETTGGSERLLAATRLAFAKSQSPLATPLSVHWRDGQITATLGTFSATAIVNEIPAGRCGIWADGAAGPVVTAFRVFGAAPGFGEPPLPDRFIKDRLMRNWASNSGAWRSITVTPEIATRWGMKSPGAEQIYVHTGDFFRDAELTVAVPDINSGARLSLHLRENLGTAIGPNSATLKSLKRSQMTGPAPELLPASSPVATTGGSRLEVERSGEEWRFTLFESGIAVGTASAPRVAGNAKSETRPLLRIVRRPLGNEQVALRVTLDGKTLISQTASAGTAGAKVLIRLKDVPPFTNHDYYSNVKPKVPPTNFSFEDAVADTTARLDYAFTGAPVDWRAGHGRWEVAERWTCQPQWSFFRGDGAVNPILWSRFAARGDWTLEAYLATPMDQTRGEKSPVDLNVTVAANGRDLDSGYSFVFAPNGAFNHLVLRGGELAQRTELVMPTIIGGVHQDWYYVRIERRATPQGLRLTWIVNGKQIADYLDANPLPGALESPGRFAFWSHNYALSIARVRIWHDGLETAEDAVNPVLAMTEAAPLPNGVGEWTARRDGPLESTASLKLVSEKSRDALKIVNPASGGDWTVFVTRKGFDAARRPRLQFDYRVPQGVFVNLYAKADGRWREILFTGQRTTGGLRPEDFAKPDGETRIGTIENVQADDQWHSVSFDLMAALKKAGLGSKIEALAFAAPQRGFLGAGIGGNHQGATYWLRDFKAPENISPV